MIACRKKSPFQEHIWGPLWKSIIRQLLALLSIQLSRCSRGEGGLGGELHCVSCEESGLHKIIREMLVRDFYCVGSRAVLFTEHTPVLESWEVPTLEITHWEEGLCVVAGSLGYISNTCAGVFCPKTQGFCEALLAGLAAGEPVSVRTRVNSRR